jgi:hypothetical protein
MLVLFCLYQTSLLTLVRRGCDNHQAGQARALDKQIFGHGDHGGGLDGELDLEESWELAGNRSLEVRMRFGVCEIDLAVDEVYEELTALFTSRRLP